MSDEVRRITIAIQDKEYLVACSEKERESLFESVDYVNKKMQDLRDGGKVLGSERIAVMAALNIAHEFLAYKRSQEDISTAVDAGIRRMQNKISDVLLRGEPLEL